MGLLGRVEAPAARYVLGMLLLVLCIEGLARAYGLPGLGKIWAGLSALAQDGTLLHDFQVSVARWWIGWCIGGTAGVLLGLLTGRVYAVRTALEGFLLLCRAIPFISLVPLVVRIFGVAEEGKQFLVAWATTGISWLIVHHTAAGLPESLKWRAQSLGADWRTWLLQILLPYCCEGIYAALRGAVSLGWVVIAVAEMAGVYERSSGKWWSEGLGYRLFRSLGEGRDDLMMASILVFAATGIVLDQLFVQSWRLATLMPFAFRKRQVAKLVRQVRLHPSEADGDWDGARPFAVSDLAAGYDGRTVLRDVSFTVPAGQTLTVVGPSGCGKSTLIRALGCFRGGPFQVSGEVRLGFDPVTAPGPWLGIVLQDAPVFEHLTVWDNVVFGNRIRALCGQDASRQAWYLLCQFGLASAAAQAAGTLSGGQRQRLALATALANRPQVLLLDEPFGALDTITRRQLQRFYRNSVFGKVTSVFVTHDLDEALTVGDLVMVGVSHGAVTRPIEKAGRSLEEWEVSDSFTRQQRALVKLLGTLAELQDSGCDTVGRG